MKAQIGWNKWQHHCHNIWKKNITDEQFTGMEEYVKCFLSKIKSEKPLLKEVKEAYKLYKKDF